MTARRYRRAVEGCATIAPPVAASRELRQVGAVERVASGDVIVITGPSTSVTNWSRPSIAGETVPIAVT